MKAEQARVKRARTELAQALMHRKSDPSVIVEAIEELADALFSLKWAEATMSREG